MFIFISDQKENPLGVPTVLDDPVFLAFSGFCLPAKYNSYPPNFDDENPEKHKKIVTENVLPISISEMLRFKWRQKKVQEEGGGGLKEHNNQRWWEKV